jgi:hypothetical protein
MNSDEVKKYIRERSELFWYIKEAEKENISLEFLVETILNFGSLDDVKKLFDLIGIEKTAGIFYKQISRKRCNYLPKVKNYFTLYFNRHVQGNINRKPT